MSHLHPQAILIFMTYHESYIFETQILNPFYFIVKVYFEYDLSIAMEMLESTLNDYITIPYNKEDIIIKTNTIKYIDIYRGKITFHTTVKDISYWGTLLIYKETYYKINLLEFIAHILLIQIILMI